MFKQVVDDEISLCLVNEALTARYAELAEDNREYLSQWLEWPRFCKTPEDFSQFVNSSLHQYAEGKSMTCAIEFRGEIVGNSGFNTINHDLKMAEIGYWLGKEYQGNGIVTRVCRYLIDHAFSELGMEKVQIAAAEGNLPSRAVCERLGMKLEGVITNREKVGGKVLSHAIYGVHRSA